MLKKHKILLIGDAPGPNTDGTDPLFPHTSTGAAARLRDLMGWTTETYLENTIRFNANHDGESLLTPSEARSRTQGILAGYGGKLVVMVGRLAASRYAPTANMPWGEVLEQSGGRRLLVIPHTSGRNRFWNDPEAKAGIRAILLAEILRLKI